VNRNTIDLERYIGQVDSDGRIMRDRILKYENDNNNLDEEIAHLNDILIEFDRKIIEEQKELKTLQAT
jgi:hypothetical protein